MLHFSFSIETVQVHSGGCKSSCDGMEDLGAFKAFNLRATNNGLVLIFFAYYQFHTAYSFSGLCIHDFFQCARKLRKLGRKKSQVKIPQHTKSIYIQKNKSKIFITQVKGPYGILITCQIAHKD